MEIKLRFNCNKDEGFDYMAYDRMEQYPLTNCEAQILEDLRNNSNYRHHSMLQAISDTGCISLFNLGVLSIENYEWYSIKVPCFLVNVPDDLPLLVVFRERKIKPKKKAVDEYPILQMGKCEWKNFLSCREITIKDYFLASELNKEIKNCSYIIPYYFKSNKKYKSLSFSPKLNKGWGIQYLFCYSEGKFHQLSFKVKLYKTHFRNLNVAEREVLRTINKNTSKRLVLLTISKTWEIDILLERGIIRRGRSATSGYDRIEVVKEYEYLLKEIDNGK